MNKALLVIDVQRDFCEGGALPALDTSSLLLPLQKCIAATRAKRIQVVFTKDWHPADHGSFRSQGGPWPLHCVANTKGAELIPPIAAFPGDLVICSGTMRDEEGYSAFESTDLAAQLQALHISSVAICGIATDYCVRASALDALQNGLDTVVLIDLIRPIDQAAAARTLQEMEQLGIKLVRASDWLVPPSDGG